MAKFNFHILKNLPAHQKKITWSTLLTLMRLFLLPFIIMSMVFGCWHSAFILFSIAAISDMLDGYLARVFNEHTFLGACLDPIVDKLLVIGVFATLASISSPLLMIPRWFVLFVLIKEVIIVAGAAALYILRGHVHIAPTKLGKMTALVQIIFIMWLFLSYFYAMCSLKVFYFFLIIVIGLLLSSLMQYVKIGMQQWRV